MSAWEGYHKDVKRTLILVLLVAVGCAGALITYQASARERDYRTLLARGDAALRNQQTFAAVEAYSGAIALRPDSMLAHLRRGETYQRRGELESAARDLQAAATLDPTAIRALEDLGDVKYQQQLFLRAADAYRQCLRLDDRAPRVSYKLALAHYRSGNIEGALAALADALRVDNRVPEAYYLQGLCFREQQHDDLARQALDKAVALSPGSIPAREELADLSRLAGRHPEELEQLQVLAGLDRAHIERQVAIGLAHARWSADPRETATSRASHADLAVLTLRSALDQTPDQPLIYGALGRVWLQIARLRDDRVALHKAIQALERVASNGAAPSDVLTLYGRALLQLGRADAAERTLQHATQRYPVDPDAFLALATAAERQHHVDAARQALVDFGALATDDQIARGIESDPNNAALLGLARRTGVRASGPAPSGPADPAVRRR